VTPLPAKERAFTPKVLAAIGGTILVWSTAYVGTRVALREFSPMSLALLRFLVASSALALYGWVKGARLPRLHDVPVFLALGFLGIFLYMWLFNVGHKTVPAATGSFLIAVTPLFTAINGAVAYRTKIHLRSILGMIVSLLGVGLIAFGERTGGSINIGVFLLLIAAWLLGLYNVWVKPLSKRYKANEITLYTFVAGTLFMLLFLPQLARELPHASAYGVCVVVGLGLFPAAIGYTLWSYALSKAPAANVASFMYLTPVVTMVLGWFWIHELPPAASLVGGLIALGGVVLTNLRTK
jgi:drug/metabolite transporter (DMT)-like permease